MVVTIPNFLTANRIKIIPVTYISPMEVRIKNLPPFPVIPSAKQPPKVRPKVNPERSTSTFAMKKAQTLSAGKGLFLPPPAIQLPPSAFMGKGTITETYTSNKKNQKTLGTYPLKSGLPLLLPKVSFESAYLPSAHIESAFSEKIARELNKEILNTPVKAVPQTPPPKALVKSVSNVKLGVEGPISVRRVLYHPPLPKITAEHSVQIKLKFWVTPNGIVDQIIPIVRGGTKMESVAIRFLKGWKFEPLPAEVKQERQWGILTVKFLVK